jgi:4-aminobutyrate aminotransferase-like enzyme
VWLTVSGARAIEIAWKLAYAKRPGSTIGFDLAYHGRSLASALLSDTERSEAFGPHGPLENHATIPFPRHLHGLCAPILVHDASVNPQEAHADKSPLCVECQRALEQASQTFEKLKSRASILFVEPAIGARGYYFAPAAFMQRLVSLARSYDLAIVSDEIQMGLRRTGPMFLCKGQAWEPDLLVLGKSLGGGILPIAAVVGPDDWIDGIGPGIESETFAAYPMACRLALETLEILQTPNLQSDIERKGEFFRSLLSNHLPEPLVTLGSGLACCVSFENLPNSGSELAFQVVKKLADQGVLVHLTGPKRNRIAAIPSLLIQESSLEMAARSILRAIEES